METTVSNEQMIEAMVNVGGSRWQKNGLDRVYFNNLPAWYGLDSTTYNSGNIASATVDGELVSNSQGRKLYAGLDGKVWFDVVTGQYFYKANYGPVAETEMFLRVINRIRAAVAKALAA